MKNVIITILAVLVLGLGGYLVYDKVINVEEDSLNNNEQNNIQDTTNDVKLIATKSDKKIYALIKDNKEIELMNISEYNGGVVYAYNSGKLYLYLYKYTQGKVNVDTQETIEQFAEVNTLGYIDLNDDKYSFVKLDDINVEGSPNSISIVDSVVYLSTSTGKIYKYDINTKKVDSSDNLGFDENTGAKLYNITNDKLVYTFSESPTVGIINVKNGEKNIISSNATFEYVYEGKIIYRQYDAVNNYSTWKYYEYNPNDNSFKQISDTTSSNSDINKSYIIPVDNYYVYVNGNVLYKYENNKSVKLYEFGGAIDSVDLISNKTLNIEYELGVGYNYGTFDLETLKFSDNRDAVSYSKVLYIK